VKHLIQCLRSDLQSLGLVSEILKLLVVVFPLIRKIYGSHWAAAFEILKSQWDRSRSSDEFLPILNSSLRLFACLRSLAAGDSNDDLYDAWIEAEGTHERSLIRVLTEFGEAYSHCKGQILWILTLTIRAIL
jgi:[phosphatase 2A protein]-leucine-carboxy methyltransferase